MNKIGAWEYFQTELAVANVNIVRAYYEAQQELGVTRIVPIATDSAIKDISPFQNIDVIRQAMFLGLQNSIKGRMLLDIHAIIYDIKVKIGIIVPAKSIDLRQYEVIENVSKEWLSIFLAMQLIMDFNEKSAEKINVNLSGEFLNNAGQCFLEGWNSTSEEASDTKQSE